jgi:hypothetical protein
MSGVLDRMVKRAHGQLPAVQPLMASPPVEPGNPVEGFEEQTSRNDQQMAAQTTPPRATMRTDDRDARRHQDPLQNLAANSHRDPLAHTSHQPETMRQFGSIDSFASKSESDLTAFGLNKTVDARRRSNEESLDREPSANNRYVIPRETTSEVRNKPYIVHTERAKSESMRMESFHDTHSEPAEQQTEIHISIGSIELRAPRTETRPKPAPFRPRVTLDEFLRRKPGNRL